MENVISFSTKCRAYCQSPMVSSHSATCCVAELRCEAALGASFRFGFNALLDCALACLLPSALERFFIASTGEQRTILSGQSSTGHGLGSGTSAKNRHADYRREVTRTRRIRGLRLNFFISSAVSRH